MPSLLQILRHCKKFKRPFNLKGRHEWICRAMTIGMLCIPFIATSQDTIRANATEKRIQEFEHSPTLYFRDTSFCWLYDYEPDWINCIDNRQITTDKAHPEIFRYKIESGIKGKFTAVIVYYYIDKKISKIIVHKQAGGQLQYDSEIYVENESAVLQKDRLAKVNAAGYIQDAKSIIGR